MTLIKDNSIMELLAGYLDRRFVFRKCKGQIIVAKKPVKKAPLSESQKKQTSRFKDAVVYAKAALADEEIRSLYAGRAAESDRPLSAFNVAVSDYMHLPVIKKVDLKDYMGGLGDYIMIVLAEDFSVVGVMVEIFRDDGSLLEVGMAERLEHLGEWVYYAQSMVASVAGYRVNVRVTDLPGNVAEREVEI